MKHYHIESNKSYFIFKDGALTECKPVKTMRLNDGSVLNEFIANGKLEQIWGMPNIYESVEDYRNGESVYQQEYDGAVNIYGNYNEQSMLSHIGYDGKIVCEQLNEIDCTYDYTESKQYVGEKNTIYYTQMDMCRKYEDVKVREDGKEVIVNKGVRSLIELTEEQKQIVGEFKQILKKLNDNHVEILFREYDGRLFVYNREHYHCACDDGEESNVSFVEEDFDKIMPMLNSRIINAVYECGDQVFCKI